jgi:hypothetical protein
MKRLYAFFSLAFLFLSFAAFGQEEASVPLDVAFKSLVDLISNYKAMSPIALSIAIVLALTSFLKTDLVGGFFKNQSALIKRLIVTVLGQVAGVLTMISRGLVWHQAIIVGMISSGGAVAIYEAYKAAFPKKK